jgi:hypothetical protein
MKNILLTLSLLLYLVNFIPADLESEPVYNHKEAFDPKLSYLNSITKISAYADSLSSDKNQQVSELDYGIIVSDVLKQRFYHGFSHYTLSENWIAATAEFILGKDLSCIVDPEEISKYPYGGCSQQSIVFMEIMKRKGYDVRNVGFPHHYASEVKIGNDWYFFDPNMEPNIPDSARKESYWKGSTDSLKRYYNRNIYSTLDYSFGTSQQVTFGKINAAPAPHAAIFFKATSFLSKIIWILPFVALFLKREKPACAPVRQTSFSPSIDQPEFSF